VQDILDRADVGRATFYAHFDNKEDLLLSGLEGLRASLKDAQRQAHSKDGPEHARLFAFTRELFAHTRDHRDMYPGMVGGRGAALIQQAFRRMLLDLVRDDVKALLPRSGSVPASVEAAVQFVAGGLFGLLRWWLDGRARNVEEVDSLFRRLAIPAVTAALR
jgi:AcrR family transcriptional regulator